LHSRIGGLFALDISPSFLRRGKHFKWDTDRLTSVAELRAGAECRPPRGTAAAATDD
jgi:hypothetical protein